MKKLFVSLFVLALILVGALFILPLLLTSDSMRQEFASRVSDISGMEIELNGPVNFSIIPDFGVVAEQVKLSAPDQSFSVSAAKIVAGVSLSAIFSGQVEITGLDIRQPEFFIDASIPASTSQNNAAASSAASPAVSNNSENKDAFASAVSTLERLAINRLTISNGTFITKAIDDTLSVVTDIEVELIAPSLDGAMELAFSANSDGQHLSLDASLDALRPILQRQPSGINIALKMEPAPHPALADLTLKGIIQLREDGSYQISDGRFATLGHPLRFDALYRPGSRPYGSLSLQADSVDLGAIKQAVSSTGSNNTPAGKTSSPAGASGKAPDLSALAGFDGDLKLAIGSFSMDGAEIRNIDLQAVLKQGVLKAKLGNATIASGKVTGAVNSDFNAKSPTFQGSVTASALDLENVARLANADIPLKGNLGLNIGYAFRGLDENTIKNSFNFAGTVGISKGILSIPALAEAGLGKDAGTISGLNVQATIKHIQKPVTVKGKMNWQGDAVSFSTQVSPRGFIQDGRGAVTLAIASSKLKADFVGNMNLSGAIDGKVSVATPSLGAVMAWLGQGQNPELKDFAYSGDIRADPNNLKFSKSSITLNGNRATGSGSLSFVGKPSITTNLAFSALDIAALTGGSSGGGRTGSVGNATGGAASAPSTDSPLDLSALQKFDANIQLQATKLAYGKVSAGPVKTVLTVKDGVAHLSLPSTPFYSGNVAAEIVANGAGEAAAISINAKMAGVDAATLFRDAAGFERLEGRLNASIKTNGAGKTTKAFSKSLKGSAAANFTNGAIKGIDVAKIYNNLATILVTGFQESSGDKTEFSELGLSFTIDNGIATTNDVKLIGPAVEMDGAGNVDLGEETIDMRLNPRFVGLDQTSQSDLSAIKIPVVIKGKLSQPQVYPDLTAVLKDPQAALGALSKLGLNIKGLGGGNGLDLGKIANGKVDLKQLALDKLKDPDTVKKIGNVIEQLVPGSSGQGNSNDVLGSLLGKLANPNAPASNAPATNAPAQQVPSNIFEGLTPASGAIAIPVSSPNGRPLATNASAPASPVPAQQPAVAPAPAIGQDTLDLEKPINDLLKNIFN